MTGITFLVLLLIITAIVLLVFKPFSTAVKSPQSSSTTAQTASKSSQKSSSPAQSATSASTSSSSSTSTNKIPASASKNDWQLVLVNLKNPKPEMNPDLVTLGHIQVDARIAQSAEEFLAAAQTIDPNVHLISGYRSVAYQTELFNGYVQQTMNENPGWTQAQAKAEVMKTSQPPQSSEHETGLAMDMSAIDELNAEDPATASAIAAMAPEYGFVLRFPSWGTSSTGIDYEDWHFRYVGVENAKYMTEHQLTLEDYLSKLDN
ncbi:MAG: D-alanyl-D-alanine carboxypeptidase family protein [Streptococcaceae bacterium]|nr:D-alanyl-D-alanine carboxypeptidase family protein [Streptococcaceae bacterium]